MKRPLNSLPQRPELPGIRPPGGTLYGDEVRGNRIGVPGLPETANLGFGLVGGIALESPDRGAASLYRERRWPGALAGEEGLRSAVMVLRGGQVGRTRGQR